MTDTGHAALPDDILDADEKQLKDEGPELTPELARELVGVALLVLGVLTLAGGVWIAVGGAWAAITLGFSACIGGLALLKDLKPEVIKEIEVRTIEVPPMPRSRA